MGKFLAEESQRLIYTYIRGRFFNEIEFGFVCVCVYYIYINKTLTLPVVYFLFFVFNGGRTFNDKRSVQSDNLK